MYVLYTCKCRYMLDLFALRSSHLWQRYIKNNHLIYWNRLCLNFWGLTTQRKLLPWVLWDHCGERYEGFHGCKLWRVEICLVGKPVDAPLICLWYYAHIERALKKWRNKLQQTLSKVNRQSNKLLITECLFFCIYFYPWLHDVIGRMCVKLFCKQTAGNTASLNIGQWTPENHFSI